MCCVYHSSAQKQFETAYNIQREQYDLELEKWNMVNIGENKAKWGEGLYVGFKA